MTEVVVITGAKISAKLQVKLSPSSNQQPTFYRLNALPITQSTVSAHSLDLLTLSSPGDLLKLSRPLKALGYHEGELPHLSSAI